MTVKCRCCGRDVKRESGESWIMYEVDVDALSYMFEPICSICRYVLRETERRASYGLYGGR